MSKKAMIKCHARRRFYSRYGIHLTRENHQKIVDAIQSGQARHLLTESNRVSHWLVEFEGQQVPVIYDKGRKLLVTALPNLERYEMREEPKAEGA